MPNVLEKIIDYLIAILLMFIVPVCYFAIKKDSIIQVNVDKNTAQFVELVSTQGYLTVDMYEKYLKDLDDTGKLYTVKLLHEQNAFEPEYKIRSAGEVIDEDESMWEGINEYLAKPVNTEPPVVDDPVSTGGLNTETNGSVLASSVSTPASPDHVHTDDCYVGHRHSSCIAIGDTSKKVTVFYYRDFNMDLSIESYGYTIWCATCTRELLSTSYRYNNFFKPINSLVSSYINYYTYNNSGSVVRKSFSDSYAPYNNADEAWHNEETNHINDRLFPYVASLPVATFYELGTDFNRTTKPIIWNHSPIEYLIKGDNLIHSIPWLSCPYCGVYGQNYSCGQVQDETPDCSKIVTSITPTHSVQTVAIGDPLITTLAAQFLDGSSHVVEGTTTFSTADIVQDQTVTLTYTYTINGVSYTKTCTIVVSVVPRSKTCINGHTYNLNTDGSDPGCPYCRNWLMSLSVLAPSSGRLTMYRNINNSLVAEGVVLLAVYLDRHVEYVYSGYVDNLDPDFVGNQLVTIGYKGLTTTLQVDVLRNKKECDVCGLYYNLLLDDSDPGCPYCRAKVPVFTGNVMTYIKDSYEDEIITEMYEGTGTYYFRRGDNFKVQISSRNKSSNLTAIGRLFGLNIRVVRTDTIKDEVIYK